MRVARSGGGRTGDRHRLYWRSYLFIQAVTLVAKAYGLRPVKLTEIPMKDRMSAARRASKTHAHNDEETCDLIAAALCPSDRIYWVRAQAFGELPAAA